MSDRRQRLERARLYLVCDERARSFLDDVLSAGVDIVQLRMKDATDEQILETGRRFAATCGIHDALFILNDRPDLAAELGADGVHVGQDDVALEAARGVLAADRLVGLSTHTPDQIDRGHAADYIGVGPVHATPTKPGRPAVGLELVRYAAAHASSPFFAIGGIDTDNVAAVCGAGAKRVAVVRAITEAPDPAAAARDLRRAVTDRRAPIGSAQP